MHELQSPELVISNFVSYMGECLSDSPQLLLPNIDLIKEMRSHGVTGMA